VVDAQEGAWIDSLIGLFLERKLWLNSCFDLGGTCWSKEAYNL
jgi:hypothetical protein